MGLCPRGALARGKREPGQALIGAAISDVPLCGGLFLAAAFLLPLKRKPNASAREIAGTRFCLANASGYLRESRFEQIRPADGVDDAGLRGPAEPVLQQLGIQAAKIGVEFQVAVVQIIEPRM